SCEMSASASARTGIGLVKENETATATIERKTGRFMVLGSAEIVLFAGEGILLKELPVGEEGCRWDETDDPKTQVPNVGTTGRLLALSWLGRDLETWLRIDLQSCLVRLAFGNLPNPRLTEDI